MMKKFTITQRWVWLFLVLTFPLLAVAQTEETDPFDPGFDPGLPVLTYVGYCEESKTMYFWGETGAHHTGDTIVHKGETLDELYNIDWLAGGDRGCIDSDVYDRWRSGEGFPFWVVLNNSHCSEARKVVIEENWIGDNLPMAGWFYGFENLEEIEGIEYLDRYGWTDMSYMFAGCHSLQTLDLRSFDTSNVTNMEGMFADCTNLRRIYCSDTWTATTSNDMFDGCTNLVGELGTRYDATHEDVSYACVDAVGTPGYFSTTPRGPMTPYAIWCVGNKTLYFTYTDDAIAEGDTFDEQPVTAVWSGTDVTASGNTSPAWFSTVSPTLTSVVFDSSFESVRPTTLRSWFGSCSKLTAIEGISNLNTSEVTDMDSMFYDCRSLWSLDVSKFDTSKVTAMGSMFYNCRSLTSLDLSNFDTSNVTDMDSMFYYCSSLPSLDLSNFNTSNVTDMSSMFYYCPSLTSLNLSSFDTSNVTDMSSMFYYCRALTSLDVSHFDTSKVTGMQRMFYYCRALTSLDVSHFDTSNVTDMSSMFYYCSSLPSLDVSHFDTSNVTDMSSMFGRCSSLTSLDLSKFDTSNVTDMSEMFYYCPALTSLDVSHFDTSNVTGMSSMFGRCSSLTSLDVSKFDTSKVTDMSSMFYGCSLTSLDVSKFDTRNVTDMGSMFSGCSALTSLDVSKFDTRNVTDMGSMFYGCSALTSLDLSKFDTSNVKYMNSMFSSCSALTTLDVSNFDISEVTAVASMFNGCSNLTTIFCDSTWTAKYSPNMFAGCTSLVGGAGTTFDTSHINATYAHPDGGTTNPGYFTIPSKTPQAIWTADGTLTFVNAAIQYATVGTFNGQTVTVVWSGADVTASGYANPAWISTVGSALTKVVFDSSFSSVRPTSLFEWFSSCSKLTAIEGISNLNTSKVTDMSGMFRNCSSLTSLDVSNFDTSKVTDMYNMFEYCSSLTSLDVSKFDTRNVTDMGDMFSGCSSLTSLDLSKFDTSKVAYMDKMFKGCSNLTTIFCDSTWTATSSNNMFVGCTKLVGEYGTEFSPSETDGSKANPGEEGYFTLSEEVLTARDGGDGWYYTTYYNGEHSRFVDDSTEVYVAQADWNNNSIILVPNNDSVDKRLLKRNAFILRSTQPTITLSLCSNDVIGGEALPRNDLEGSAKTEDVWGGGVDFYTLGRVGGVLGFYKYTGEMLNARKAFLWTMNEAHGGGAPLRFSFGGEDTATGLDEVQSTKYDVQSTSIYDLQGRRVAQPTKGIYIVNGKKVFMK